MIDAYGIQPFEEGIMPNVIQSWMGRILFCACLTVGFLAGCDSSSPPPAPAGAPTQEPSSAAVELVLYNWVDYMPQSVLDAFTRETGVRVRYEVYESQEEAADNIEAGKVYDMVVMPSEQIPRLTKAGKLAAIDYRNVPNFKYVSANFRDLTFDPGNRYSIPYRWGTTGLLVRTDLVQRPVTRWKDLWDPAFAGKVALWPIPRSVIPIALRTLGYSVNTTNPAELEEALRELLKLKPSTFLVGNDNTTVVPFLQDGRAVIAFGWAYDALTAQRQSLPIQYVIPEEGTVLWGDHFVIPAATRHKREAEAFLNFILRPEITAQIVNESYYPMPNDAATPMIRPEILDNPLIFPPNEELRKAELVMPVGEDGESLYRRTWERFLADGQ
jgi:spermidine/putrescine transport system substrate-binding protein